MTRVMDRLEADLLADPTSIRGVVVSSAKTTFFAGGDLAVLQAALPQDALRIRREVDSIKRQLRRLETIGRPVVAAINGAALGGGFEIALACHVRIAVDDPGTRVGLPEVTYGLLPGGGGVIRTIRLLGMRKALTEVLLHGQLHSAQDALALGIVDALAPDPEALLRSALAWIDDHPTGGQPWDADGSRATEPKPLPAGPRELVADLTGLPEAAMGTPATRAQEAMASTALEGARLGFEDACDVETDHFVDLIIGPVAKNMIQGRFFDLRSVNAGLARPPTAERGRVAGATVLGAGTMGPEIAAECAKAGIEVTLQDVPSDPAAEYPVRPDIDGIARFTHTVPGSDLPPRSPRRFRRTSRSSRHFSPPARDGVLPASRDAGQVDDLVDRAVHQEELGHRRHPLGRVRRGHPAGGPPLDVTRRQLAAYLGLQLLGGDARQSQ